MKAKKSLAIILSAMGMSYLLPGLTQSAHAQAENNRCAQPRIINAQGVITPESNTAAGFLHGYLTRGGHYQLRITDAKSFSGSTIINYGFSRRNNQEPIVGQIGFVSPALPEIGRFGELSLDGRTFSWRVFEESQSISGVDDIYKLTLAIAQGGQDCVKLEIDHFNDHGCHTDRTQLQVCGRTSLNFLMP